MRRKADVDDGGPGAGADVDAGRGHGDGRGMIVGGDRQEVDGRVRPDGWAHPHRGRVRPVRNY